MEHWGGGVHLSFFNRAVQGKQGGGGILMIFNKKKQHMVIQNRSPGEQRPMKRSFVNQYCIYFSKAGTLTST